VDGTFEAEDSDEGTGLGGRSGRNMLALRTSNGNALGLSSFDLALLDGTFEAKDANEGTGLSGRPATLPNGKALGLPSSEVALLDGTFETKDANADTFEADDSDEGTGLGGRPGRNMLVLSTSPNGKALELTSFEVVALADTTFETEDANEGTGLGGRAGKGVSDFATLKLELEVQLLLEGTNFSACSSTLVAP